MESFIKQICGVACALVQKGYFKKFLKKQARDLSTTGREKTADSSFSWQHENYVTGEKTSQDEVLVEADLK